MKRRQERIAWPDRLELIQARVPWGAGLSADEVAERLEIRARLRALLAAGEVPPPELADAVAVTLRRIEELDR